MNEEIKQLSIKFNKIKKMGWIKTIRNGNCGVGATLEKLLCIEENSLEIPDFDGIEIKARRMYSKSYITMFSSTPTGPYYHEIARIKELYGLSDFHAEKLIKEEDMKCKRYHNSFCEGKWGDSRNYDISINSSKSGLENTLKITATTDITPITKGSAKGVYTSC